MRVRQIGTLVFDANTNIIVDANNQDAPGVGFRADSLFDPQPFSVEIAFRRSTRQQALNAVNTLARELHSYAQRRQNNYFAVAGGVLVVAEDETGGTSLRSYLRDGSVTLLSVEATSTGVLARVRVTGTLVNPFTNYTATQTPISSLLPYERRLITLAGTSDAYLYKNFINQAYYNMSGLYNALLAIEELESATGTSRIQAINPASVSSGITTQSWNAGWATLTRANFSSATSGTITYTIPTSPRDIYRLFIEIYCPTPPPSNARYLVSWPGQPQIAETISGDRSWYTPTLIATESFSFPLTLEIQNVPTGTLVMPITLIPVDGVYIWNIITPPTLSSYRVITLQHTNTPALAADPPGTIYGPPGFISSRYVAVFNGSMSPSLSGAYSWLAIYACQIEPAAFA
jgi:hypothetical protein